MFATPARNRTSQSRAPSSVPRSSSRLQRGTQSSVRTPRSTPRTINISELPPYEPPEAPLNREAQRNLAALLHTPEWNNLRIQIEHASELLTDSAGRVNEGLLEARNRYEKSKESRRNRTGGEELDEEFENEKLEELGSLERRTEAVTALMDEKMREIIDSGSRMQALKESILQLQREEQESQVASMGPRRTRAQRHRGDDEEEDADEDPEDRDYEGTPERETREANARNPPSRRLAEALSDSDQKWKELTLTERYAQHNSYVGFYRMVHNAKYPNNKAPPLPHSSTWFEHLEDPNASRNDSAGHRTRSARSRRQASDESDDDIAIESERISIRCPLTLLPFQDPVTSTKCPHSFEREAIYDMIRRSDTFAPGPNRGRVRSLKCPVCSTTLTKDDLRADPVLLRQVRRAEEAAAREAEERLEENSQLHDVVHHVTLGSDAVKPDGDSDVDVDMDEDAPVPSARVKMEPVERERARSTEDEEEEEEEEEEEDEEEGESDVEMDSD